MTDDNKVFIQYMALSDLLTRFHPQNPKQHDIGKIAGSITELDYRMPVMLDEDSGKIAAGHGRTKTLADMKRQQMDRPDGILADGNGEWLVPTIRGSEFTPEKLRAYLVADNADKEGFDPVKLTELLVEIKNEGVVKLESTGYDGDDLDQLLRELGMLSNPLEDPGAQINKADELREKWQTERGQLWGVGNHRILCGDSTDADDVARLMDGVKAEMMITDPPYGVNYDATWREDYDQFERHSVAPVINDDIYTWLSAFKLFVGDVAYVWCASQLAHHVGRDIELAGFDLRSLIIWNKQHFTFSRGHYHWKHEPCWYAVRKGRTAHWSGDRTQTTVWDIPNSNPMGGSDRTEKTIHSTEKPIECMEKPIRNHEARIVYDPFLGSGTTLVACEKLGRIGYGMEIAPEYVAVSLERLAGMGLEPRLENE